MTSVPATPRKRAPKRADEGTPGRFVRAAKTGAAGAGAQVGAQAKAKPTTVLDLRIMRGVTQILLALLAVVLVIAGVRWLRQTPAFPMGGAEVVSPLQRVNLPTLRAQVAPLLKGNFFGMDLDKARTAFEAVPWVRRAEVRRVWPDRLVVKLEEHRAAALWEGNLETVASERLVNDLGEVFEASAADLEDPAAPQDSLPSFAGPEGSAASVLALYRRLTPLLAQMDQRIDLLQLSERGSWRAELRSGTVVELGRGSEDQLALRTARFVATAAEATSRWQAPLEVVDLRHTDGYAVRLRGISVTPAASAPGAGGAVKTAMAAPIKRTP